MSRVQTAKIGDKIVATNITRNFEGLRNNHVYTILRIYESDGKTFVAVEGICEGEDLPGWYPERFIPLLNTAPAEMLEET
jgi:hypothetical protein